MARTTLTFLFWNLNRKPLAQRIARLAERHEVDVIVLAELPPGPGRLLRTLNAEMGEEFEAPPVRCPRLEVYTRFDGDYLRAVGGEMSGRFSILRLALPGVPEMLVAVAHLPSKLHAHSADQFMHGQDLARAIEKAEDDAGHHRTVVMGDLNQNPFDMGVAAAGALHAVMSRDVATKRSRTVAGRDYLFFYNPMWEFFGDARAGRPAGTYYHGSPGQMGFFWNMLDQVLIRPDLLPRLGDDCVEILTHDGADALVAEDGRPDKRRASDHLPILFRLDGRE